MPSRFELAIQKGIRQLAKSAVSREILYRQATDETTLRVAWYEAESPALGPSLAVEITLIESDLPRLVRDGDEVESESKVYEVRKIGRPAVGILRLGLRLKKVIT